MNDIIVALIAFAGTLGGSALGIMQAGKVTDLRLKSLEEKVNKHNQVIERMAVAENTIKSQQHQIDEIRDYCGV